MTSIAWWSPTDCAESTPALCSINVTGCTTAAPLTTTAQELDVSTQSADVSTQRFDVSTLHELTTDAGSTRQFVTTQQPIASTTPPTVTLAGHTVMTTQQQITAGQTQIPGDQGKWLTTWYVRPLRNTMIDKYTFFIRSYIYVADFLNRATFAASDCEFVTLADHVQRDSAEHTSQLYVTYWCDFGYRLVGGGTMRTLVCQSNGQWSSPVPQCEGTYVQLRIIDPLLMGLLD